MATIIVAVPDITFAGGAEQVARDIAVALLPIAKVVLVSAFSRDSERGMADAAGAPEVEVCHLGLARPRSPAAKLAMRCRLLGALLHAVPDAALVIGNNFFRYWALPPLGRGPVCVEVQHLRYEEARPNALRLALRNQLYRWLDGVVVLTERDRVLFARHGVGHVTVLHNAVARPAAVADPAGRRRKLIAVGRLTAQKNFAVLLDAWQRVAAHLPGWTLEIFGDGDDRQRLMARAVALGISESVHFAGHVADHSRIYGDAALLCSVSLYEGFPLALCEALAHGVPVVAFDYASGPRELIAMGEIGRVVPFGDLDRLVAALIEMASDAALRVGCAHNAREVSRRFAFDAFGAYWREYAQAQLRQRGASTAQVATPKRLR